MNSHQIIYDEIKEGGYTVYKEIRDRYVYFKRKNGEAEPQGYGYNKQKLADKIGRSISYINTSLRRIEAVGLIQSFRRVEKVNGTVVEFWTYKPIYDLDFDPHCEELATKIIQAKEAEIAMKKKAAKLQALTKKYGKREGYVYIILDEFDRVKIGLSDKPQKRFTQIKGAAGVDFKNTFVSQKLFNCQFIEGKAHKMFDKYRINGEWFKGLNFEEAIDGVNSIISSHDELLLEQKSLQEASIQILEKLIARYENEQYQIDINLDEY